MLRTLAIFATLFLFGACDTGPDPFQGAGGGGLYQQPCSPGANQCGSYQSQRLGRAVPMQCFQHRQGQSLCTHSCSTDADCDAPSPGCNGMGVCKRPGG